MSTIKHHVKVVSGSAVLVKLGTEPKQKGLTDTYQAQCECGWTGPRRTRQYDAQDDAIEHQRNPQEDQ